jgi:tellurite resistance protein TerC
LNFETVGSPALWGAFLVGVLFMLALDLGVFNRKAHRVGVREALIWSAVWVALSLAFNAYIWVEFGRERAVEWLFAYGIEKALSVDNIFVFVVLFRYILVGLGLIAMFSWTLYLFGAFLVYTGIKLVFFGEGEQDGGADAGDNWVKRKAEKWFRVTREFEGPRFFVRRDGVLYVTTLFVTLLMVETSDVIFALDSIPAIFGITKDPFIVFTSNVCAVLGLRAMFFLLENIIDRFHYLQTGLGIALSFIGVKMLLGQGLGGMGLYAAGVGKRAWLEPIHLPVEWSLAFVGTVLVGSILLSLLFPRDQPAPP